MTIEEDKFLEKVYEIVKKAVKEALREEMVDITITDLNHAIRISELERKSDVTATRADANSIRAKEQMTKVDALASALQGVIDRVTNPKVQLAIQLLTLVYLVYIRK